MGKKKPKAEETEVEIVGANPKKQTPSTNIPLARFIVELLNDMLQSDSMATVALVGNRIPVNMKLANHPVIQTLLTSNGFSVGFLGILNGLCGVTEGGSGYIVAKYDPQFKFPVLVEFVLEDGIEGIEAAQAATDMCLTSQEYAQQLSLLPKEARLDAVVEFATQMKAWLVGEDEVMVYHELINAATMERDPGN